MDRIAKSPCRGLQAQSGLWLHPRRGHVARLAIVFTCLLLAPSLAAQRTGASSSTAIVLTVAVTPASGTGGSPFRGNVTLTMPRGAIAPTELLITSDNPAVTVQRTVAITAGPSQSLDKQTLIGTFSGSTTAVASSTRVTIEVTQGLTRGVATMTLLPPSVTGIRLDMKELPIGQTTRASLTLNGPAPAGFSLPLSGERLTIPASVAVPAGQRAASFEVTAASTGAFAPTRLTVGEGSTAMSVDVPLRTPVTVESVTVSPSTVKGGASATATVTLDYTAGSNGVTASVRSKFLGAGNVASSSVTIPAGGRSATIQITTNPVASRTPLPIGARIEGRAEAIGEMTLTPVQVSSFSCGAAPEGARLVGGRELICQVGLDSNAPPLELGSSDQTRMPVYITASNASAVPASNALFVPNRNMSNTFSIHTQPVTVDTPVTLTAGDQNIGTRTLNLTIIPLSVESVVYLNVNGNNSVPGGHSPTSAFHFTLNGDARSGGFVVPLSVSDPALIVPPSITVSAGSRTTSFQGSTNPVATITPVTLTAGQSPNEKSITVNVMPPTIASFAWSPGPPALRLGLSGKTPAGGWTLPVTSSDLAVTAPASVTVPAGQNWFDFNVTPMSVDQDTTATITVGQGAEAKSVTLTLEAVKVQALFVDSMARVGGDLFNQGRVVLNKQASIGGFTVPLTSSNPAAVTVPATIAVAQGSTEKLFPITTAPVTEDTTVIVTAGQAGSAKTGTITLTVHKPRLLTVSPQNVAGGTIIGAQLELNGRAPAGGFVVPLSSSIAAATVPGSVTVPANQTTVTFQITTTAVETDTSGVITAGTGATAQTANIVVRKP